MKITMHVCCLSLAGMGWAVVAFAQPPGIYTDTASGGITVTSGGVTVEARVGQFTFTPPPAPGGIALPPRLVPPSQGIVVTMPPSISNDSETGGGIGEGKSNSCTMD